MKKSILVSVFLIATVIIISQTCLASPPPAPERLILKEIKTQSNEFYFLWEVGRDIYQQQGGARSNYCLLALNPSLHVLYQYPDYPRSVARNRLIE